MNDMMDMIIKLKGCCEREEQKIMSTLELKPSEYRALALMKPDHTYTNDQLSREIGLSKSRGCRVFEKLLQKGYLRRRENNEDKRSFLYQLTRSGKKIKEKITSLKRSCESKILSKEYSSQGSSVYVFYFHPWELDPDQPRVYQAKLSYRFRHYNNLKKTTKKLISILQDFGNCNFVSCNDYITGAGFNSLDEG